jgi:hypothetical protein
MKYEKVTCSPDGSTAYRLPSISINAITDAGLDETTPTHWLLAALVGWVEQFFAIPIIVV